MTLVQIPAVCELCSRPFPSGFAANNIMKLTLSGNRAGPCPWCGYAWGAIPDGVFNVIDGAMSLVQRLPTTRDDMLIAAQIFNEAIAQGRVDVDALSERIKAEAPSASPLLKILRDPATASLLAILAILVSILLATVNDDGGGAAGSGVGAETSVSISEQTYGHKQGSGADWYRMQKLPRE
ncbi:hypothetical protein GS436_02860 [Rhodococcus hoagii]|uniref:Uncharacterized protein n=1 Tax=Rhodococcus hoagii TaxID=43767 RepID=A0AAE2W431_RHOHA|nr:hypothetical protein [Prescottella equi]MBM4492595.1 hypothetical protein [Prescottella equi]MBM4713644.1 hypothetical protein [Prescottella equi]NKS11971.1 hypothetical protein [Prescottella equi]OQQ28700.1 hypothetical protein A4U94_01245 [Prescottella equi]